MENRNTVFFDLETTGTNTTTDRIVQIAAVLVNGSGIDPLGARNMLINPGQPIPPEATGVHGITDEMVKDAPTFRQISKGLFTYLEGCDLGGFNILKFDVPLLSEEFARVGIQFPAPGTLFYDSHVIFREKERRDLSAALQFYCGREHTDAHDAQADIIATVDVFTSQLLRYPDLGEMTPEDLSTFCVGANVVDLAGKIKLDDQGREVYAFGKDAGKLIKENPGFANWMLQPKQDFTTDTKNHLRRILGYKDPAPKLF